MPENLKFTMLEMDQNNSKVMYMDKRNVLMKTLPKRMVWVGEDPGGCRGAVEDEREEIATITANEVDDDLYTFFLGSFEVYCSVPQVVMSEPDAATYRSLTTLANGQ
jgi:hypothetical protein